MTGQREMTFLLAGVEWRVLQRLAERVPRTIRSNHLTALGMLGAAGAGTAYALTTYNPAWLWVASLMLGVNWLGDSLDGTLARSEEHTSELQSRLHLVCRLLLEKKKKKCRTIKDITTTT